MKVLVYILNIFALCVNSFVFEVKRLTFSSRNHNLPLYLLRTHHNLNNILLLSIEPTSKTTTYDDPTAGMTAEEIQNYISNVGGGMCDYPETIRTAVGLGLNISLLLFGILTIGYVASSGYNFVLEKQIEDLEKKMKKEAENPQPVVNEAAGSLNRQERRMKRKLKKDDEPKP